MLQVARLAPTQLGESRDLVAAFFRERLNADGGFQDRTGTSDLYYTVFGLDGLIALQDPLPPETARYLDRFDDLATLDIVHACCLARAYAALQQPPDPERVDRILARVESFRSGDGGYATTAGAPSGSPSTWYLTTSVSLKAPSNTQPATAPVTTPWLSAWYTSGAGIEIGEPPIAVTISATVRSEARSFMPAALSR